MYICPSIYPSVHLSPAYPVQNRKVNEYLMMMMMILQGWHNSIPLCYINKCIIKC